MATVTPKYLDCGFYPKFDLNNEGWVFIAGGLNTGYKPGQYHSLSTTRNKKLPESAWSIKKLGISTIDQSEERHY